eukprot:m.91234 g.91234  ORF g.91234 m.91234 type:complete len:402 (+) comp20177_c0_seq1:519-1724(+)
MMSSLDSMLAYVVSGGAADPSADEELEIKEEEELTDDVFILGQHYSHANHFKEIGWAARSLPWFTYRRGFPTIANTPLQCDAGWGCMLRCGQMLVAESLLRHRGGDLSTEAARSARMDVRKDVLSLFADVPAAVYSIHNIALGGLRKMKKPVGEWFGPNCLAQVLREISVDALSTPAAGGGPTQSVVLATHVAMDSIVCIDDVLLSVQKAVDAVSEVSGGVVPPTAAAAAAAPWHPLLLLIPLRLGLDDMAERYFAPLSRVFGIPQCVGATGGRPNAAFYFVGCRGDLLLYLDPHMPIQPTVGAFRRDTSIASYASPGLLSLPMAEADPSMCLGFLCSTRNSFDDFLARVAKMKADFPDVQPLFTVVQKDVGGAGGADDFSFTNDSGDDDDDDAFELINVP